MALLAVMGHGTDTGTPPAFLVIGVFPDGTTYDAATQQFSNPAGESFTVRVDPSASAADVIGAAQKLYAAQQAAQAANAAGLANLQSYIGQLIPASGPNPAAQPAAGTALPPQPELR